MRQQHRAGEKGCGSMDVQAGAEASPKLACEGPSAQTSRGEGMAQRRKSLSSSPLPLQTVIDYLSGYKFRRSLSLYF